jgi:DNA-binding transcriptional LysR family regulator
MRHLDALATVAEERSISRAAERLGYTQSAVSQQIRALERIVGVDVLVRSPGARTVELTDAGTRLLRHAEGIRTHVGYARRDLDELAETTAGTVCLGSVPSAARVLVPPLVTALRERAPEIVLQVEESHLPDTLFERLAAGELDLVIAPIAGDAPDVPVLLDDPYVLLVPEGDPFLALARPLTADDLRDRDLVAKDCGTPSQRDLDAALTRLGIATRTVVRANDGATVHGLVASGVGIAVISRLLAYGAPAGTRTLPLDGVLPPRRIGLHGAGESDADPRIALVAALLQAA